MPAESYRRLRVLHCIPSLASGGAERQLSLLAPAQRAVGIDAHVAYVHDGPHAGALRAGGVSLHRIAVSRNRDPRLVLRLASLIARLRPDVVQTWLPMMDVTGGAAALLTRRPWILTERSVAEAYPAKAAGSRVRHWLGGRADAVIANSEVGGQYWSRRYRGEGGVHVIRNALALDAISLMPPACLADLGVGAGQPVVLFVGRLSEEKNIKLLLEVARDVCAASEAVFLVCGDGPLRSSVETEALRSPLRGRLRTLGVRHDVWALMKAARVLVSTSVFEGQPNAVLEAMACGCPLVVSDIAAHREFLDAETAAVVPLARASFAAAVCEVLARPELATQRALAARRAVVELSLGRAVEAHLAVYRQIVRRHVECVE